jgi:hypothetical protein
VATSTANPNVSTYHGGPNAADFGADEDSVEDKVATENQIFQEGQKRA